MFVAKLLVCLVALLVPIGLYAAASSRGERRPSSLRAVVLTFVFGLLAFVPVQLLERWLTGAAGQRAAPTTPFGLDLTAIVYAFLVAAPLEEGLKFAAATPVWRLRVAQHRPFDGIAYATAAGLGFATSQNAVFLLERPLSFIDPLRAVLAAITAMSFAGLWGYALGKGAPLYRLGGGLFNAAWVAAVAGNAISHHVLFVLGPNATLAMIPILITSLGLSWYGARELLAGPIGEGQEEEEAPKIDPRGIHAPRKPGKPPLTMPKPTMRALRAALRHAERPISLMWIVTGAIVTTGVITAMLVAAVLLGRRLGVDFTAVDRDASQAEAIPPLLLLSGAVLFAFPLAGWIVARASAAKSVIEPAISSLFAIVAAIVLLGLAAPVAVVIALACAPFAFGLAYFGAWLGLSSQE